MKVLEILADRSNPEKYLVYADQLQAEGDPRGELITLQIQMDSATGKEREALEKRAHDLMVANDGFLPDVSSEHATVERWHWGFFDAVRFENNEDWMNDDWDCLPIVRKVFAQPAAAGVTELRVGVLRWMFQAEDAPKLLAEVADLGFAERIEVLRVGDISNDIDLAHHPLGSLDVIGRSYRSVRSLTVTGSEFGFGALPAPSLRSLVVQTCGLSRDALRAIIGTRRDHLEHLELWFGSEDYGSEATIDDLEDLLVGENFPKLESLGLMNAEFTDELCGPLADSALLPRLDRLNLSMGTLDAPGVEVLLARADRFKHLSEFSIDDNYVDTASVAELQSAIGEFVYGKEVKEVDVYEGVEYRYVTVRE